MPEAKPIGRPIKISKERIIKTALDLLDEDGIDFSVRKLAKRLNTGPTTIYNNFFNRNGLLKAMSEAGLQHIWPDCDENLPWEDSLREWANTFRANLIRHPATLSLSTVAIESQSTLEHLRQVARVIESSGIPHEEAVRQAQGMTWLVAGSVKMQELEISSQRHSPPPPAELNQSQDIAPYLSIFDTKQGHDRLWKSILDRCLLGLRAMSEQAR